MRVLFSRFPFQDGIRNFLDSADGAVTIEWTALISGIIILATALVFAIYRDGVAPVTGTIEATMASSEMEVAPEIVDIGFLLNE